MISKHKSLIGEQARMRSAGLVCLLHTGTASAAATDQASFYLPLGHPSTHQLCFWLPEGICTRAFQMPEDRRLAPVDMLWRCYSFGACTTPLPTSDGLKPPLSASVTAERQAGQKTAVGRTGADGISFSGQRVATGDMRRRHARTTHRGQRTAGRAERMSTRGLTGAHQSSRSARS